MKTKQKKIPDKKPHISRHVTYPFGTKKAPSLGKMTMSLFLLAGLIAPAITPSSANAQTVTNLVGNADVETTMLVPAGWNRGGFGENAASFSYPQSGIGGSRAVRVDMTSYESGDAKWYFDDVPV
jgi:hypothetical protein